MYKDLINNLIKISDENKQLIEILKKQNEIS